MVKIFRKISKKALVNLNNLIYNVITRNMSNQKEELAMKKSSKLISLLLALVLATSCFVGFSAFTASAADDTTLIYFEVPTLESWGTTKSVFCHVYNVYGGSELKGTSWQSKSEKCKLDSATGLYYFDTSKLGTIEDGADYALLFSTKDTDGNSHQTCNVTFGKECLGDTVYVTGGMVENTEDSTKMDFEATWKNPELAKKYGAKAAITSTGKVVGNFFPVYQPKEQIVSQAIASWAVINASIYTPEVVQGLCAEFGVEAIDVYNQYEADYAEKLADPENNPNLASLETVAALLNVDPNATEPETTEPTTAEPTTEPTTEAPTTEPTTAEPTTEPTTEAPTTEAPTTEPTEPADLYGDVNDDGVITIEDATVIQKMGIGMVEVNALADVNGDGRISILDVTFVQKYINGGYANTGLVGTPVA